MVPTSIVRTPSTSRGSTSATMKVRLPISCFIGWSSRRSTDHRLVTVATGATGRIPTAAPFCLGESREHPDGRPDRHRRLLQDHRAGLDGRAGDPRRRRHLHHDGLHRRPQPADPRLRAGRRRQVPRRRRRAEPPGDRRRYGAGRRRDDDPDGRRRQLSAGAGHRTRAQRVRRLRHRQPDDLGRRDGPGGHRGRRSSWCWCSPASGRRCSTPSRPSSRSRSRWASACSSHSSGSSTPASCTASPTPPTRRCPSSSARTAS